MSCARHCLRKPFFVLRNSLSRRSISLFLLVRTSISLPWSASFKSFSNRVIVVSSVCVFFVVRILTLKPNNSKRYLDNILHNDYNKILCILLTTPIVMYGFKYLVLLLGINTDARQSLSCAAIAVLPSWGCGVRAAPLLGSLLTSCRGRCKC